MWYDACMNNLDHLCEVCSSPLAKRARLTLCPSCRKNQYNKEYYKVHQEELKTKQRIWSKDNQIYAREQARLRHVRNKDARNAKNREWRLAHPTYDHDKHIKNREHNLARMHKYYWANRDKRIKYSREYRKLYPEKQHQSYAKWASKKEFLYKRPREYWHNRYILLYIQKLPCSVCGSLEKREIHHIIPVSKKGSHSLENLQVLCFTCHRQAGYGLHSINQKG